MRADLSESDAAIPLPNVNGPILTKVIEYCKFHVAAEKKVGTVHSPASVFVVLPKAGFGV